MAEERLSTTRRRPQARVLRNDDRVLDASEAILSDTGWGGFNVATIARKSKLSHPAVKDRFPSKHEGAELLWKHRVAERVTQNMASLLELVGTSTGPISREAVETAFQPWVQPGTTMRAAAELLVLANHDAPLQEAVATSLGALVGSMCKPSKRLSPEVAAQRGYLANLALGFLLIARRKGIAKFDFGREWESLADALNNPGKPQDVPKLPGLRTIDKLNFDTGHPEHDALLRATLELVAEQGYHDVRIDDIGDAIGVTKGFIFARYDRKQALFIDATRRQRGMSIAANLKSMADIARSHGNSIAEVALMQDVQKPRFSRIRALDLEQLMLLWHDKGLRDAEEERLAAAEADYAQRRPDTSEAEVKAHVHVARALGVGIGLLPFLLPTAHRLAYEIVTQPLHDRDSSMN